MGKHNSKKKQRKVQRSVYSGKIINGRDVILASEVFDYVKKLGYKIKDGNK